MVTVVLTAFVTIGGTGVGPHHSGRPVDAPAVLLLLVASAASGFARRWPVPALAASLAATTL